MEAEPESGPFGSRTMFCIDSFRIMCRTASHHSGTERLDQLLFLIPVIPERAVTPPPRLWSWRCMVMMMMAGRLVAPPRAPVVVVSPQERGRQAQPLSDLPCLSQAGGSERDQHDEPGVFWWRHNKVLSPLRNVGVGGAALTPSVILPAQLFGRSTSDWRTGEERALIHRIGSLVLSLRCPVPVPHQLILCEAFAALSLIGCSKQSPVVFFFLY